MKNQCRDMMEKIKTPNSLKDKVLKAAYAVQPGIDENSGYQTGIDKSTRHQPRHKVAFRVAVCAAFTFIILIGGVYYFKPGTDSRGSSASQSYHFGFVAYAADRDETLTPEGNKLAFSIADSSGGEVPGKGDYTGCLFGVTGDGIKTITAAIDRGGFYKYKKLTNLTKGDIEDIYASEDNGTLKADCQFASSDDEKTWCSEQVTALGSSFCENWASDLRYGFWVAPELINHSADEDPKEAAHKNIDTFNGATLIITATFEDGSQQTKTLHLKTGKLKVVYNEDNTQTLLPEPATGNDPYIYSVYAELDN